MQLLNIGYDGFVQKSKIIAILAAGSSGFRHLKEEAKATKRLIDATHGHKARSIIVTISDNVILSAVETKTLNTRNIKDKE
jgi:regulator of extracellular matrix RemA (YlzA/DUF370 family)